MNKEPKLSKGLISLMALLLAFVLILVFIWLWYDLKNTSLEKQKTTSTTQSTGN